MADRIPAVDLEYLRTTLLDLCRIPSPTGMTKEAVRYVERACADLGLRTVRTTKGALVATLPGAPSGPARTLAAHVDTLGAMVAFIKRNGRLQLTQIGGYAWTAIEGEYCTIHTFDGRAYTGTIMVNVASSHVHDELTGHRGRTYETIEVRIDAPTSSADETRALGIGVGDVVSFDARPVATDHGYIKSRHLDDKAAVACLLAAAKALGSRALDVPTHFFISNYEEVGHGAATGIPEQTEELVAIDMAAIDPEYQTSDEFSVTICVKDSSGPYDPALSARLRRIAIEHDIPYKVDTYRYYSSDASAAQRAGGAYRAGLIGPGVDASHSFERTHDRALLATSELCVAYMLSPWASVQE